MVKFWSMFLLLSLVDGGYILPPKVVVKQLPMIKGRKVMYAEDADNLIETLDNCKSVDVVNGLVDGSNNLSKTSDLCSHN